MSIPPQDPVPSYSAPQAYPFSYPVESRGARSPHGASMTSAVLAGILALWSIAQAVLLQPLLRSGDLSLYRVISELAGWGVLALSLGALITGIIGARHANGRLLAGIGLGVGAYVLLSGLIWLIIGLFG